MILKKGQYVEIKPIPPSFAKYGMTNPDWLKHNEVVEMLNDVTGREGHNSVVFVRRKDGTEETILLFQIVKKIRKPQTPVQESTQMNLTESQKKKAIKLLTPIVMEISRQLKEEQVYNPRTESNKPVKYLSKKDGE